jgi:hypothetical protein
MELPRTASRPGLCGRMNPDTASPRAVGGLNDAWRAGSVAESPDMAIKPHCVVCGFESDAAGSVEFADYRRGWEAPTGPHGSAIIGWSNDLGVTAPPGVALFCERHLPRARRLRRLSAAEAVQQLSTQGAAGSGRWSRLRSRLRLRR